MKLAKILNFNHCSPMISSVDSSYLKNFDFFERLVSFTIVPTY